MAFEQPGFSFTLLAAADLRTHQFKFVAVDTAGKAALAGDGVYVCGVLQNKPNIGETATIVGTGISKVVAGAAIATPGLAVTPDANGKAKTAATGDFVTGIALQAASGDGIIIPVLLQPRGDASA